jgi:hypothetical protein
LDMYIICLIRLKVYFYFYDVFLFNFLKVGFRRIKNLELLILKFFQFGGFFTRFDLLV